MLDYNVIFSFALAYLITFATVPLVRVMAFKINAVDVPKDKRRMHKKPIPRLGGAAIFLGFIVSVTCFATVIDKQLLGILIGSLIIVVTGMIDDTYQLNPILKLLGQIIAAVIVIAMGVKIEFLANPFSAFGTIIDLNYLSVPITFIWIIIMTNAVNLIDGLDGLAASISGISALALVFICLIFGNINMAIVLVAVAGACFGFLPFNQHPAKIFMGDTGALFLGFILACLSIQGFFKSYALITLIVPIIVLALPIFDTSFAIIRRLIKRQGIMSADRGHLHHRLVDKGFSHRETVIMMSTISAMFSITAILLTTKGFNRAIVLIIAMILFAVSASIYQKNKSVARDYLDALNNDEEEEEKDENE